MNISRRTILLASAAAAAVVATASNFLRPMAGFAGRKLTAVEKSACALTVEAMEGPFWVSDMPVAADGAINSTNLPGTAIEVSGHVYDGIDATKPIAGAEVEIWHADNSGEYHPNGNGTASGYRPEELALRGTVVTNADGSYRLSTIFPGEYTGRVRHYHFKIRAAGKAELTTQLIFPARPGDVLTFDTDDIAEGLPNCQQLTVDETTTPAKASFDFRV